MSLDEAARAGHLPDLAGLLERCPVDGYETEFVSWGFFSPRLWRNYWHSHSYYEVCLAFSGHGRFSCGEQDHEVTSGDVFLARPGVVHEIESARDRPLGIAFWGFALEPQQTDARSADRGWWSGLIGGLVVSNRLGHLPTVLAALSDEARQPRSGVEGVCAALGAALVIETARAFATDEDLIVPPRDRDRGSQVVATMHRYLLDNLSRPLSVRDVAAVVHLSERHAERLFAEQMGESLMATLRRLRLQLAGRQLLDKAKSTHEIARACGYRDLSAFRIAFRRQHGQTPQAFRASGGTLHLTAAVPAGSAVTRESDAS